VSAKFLTLLIRGYTGLKTFWALQSSSGRLEVSQLYDSVTSRCPPPCPVPVSSRAPSRAVASCATFFTSQKVLRPPNHRPFDPVVFVT
jgi:hypothetical protein